MTMSKVKPFWETGINPITGHIAERWYIHSPKFIEGDIDNRNINDLIREYEEEYE
jgi:hypothetical protein